VNWESINRYISHHKFFDLLPVDLTLHFIIGAVLVVYCLRKNLSYRRTMAILFCVALGKEIFDYLHVLPASPWEYISDFSVTMVYGILLWPWRKVVSHHRASVERRSLRP
jgi:hypothetical protein